ncbi:MAG TPA: NF038122 family metalloprotease [Pyrinomonadaceae bacterium]|nr:NF038122 family metalloprotease [Pyrinomonadaceae bacterium]
MSNLISKSSTRSLLRTARPLALALLLGFLTSLPPGVRAQTISPVKGGYVSSPELGQAFVIYQSPGGETVCRDASPAEAREINRRPSVPLRRINHLEDVDAYQPYASSGSGQKISATTGLTIILRATAQLDANPAAKQAFINAAARWEALIADPITVTIDVDYGSTSFGTPFPSSNTLGLTSSSGFIIPYTTVRSRLVSHVAPGSEEAVVISNLPAASLPADVVGGSVSDVFVPPALMSALGLSMTNPPVPKIGFNSAFGFDFDPNDGVTPGLTDFDSVAVHEIGHALGFTSQGGSGSTRASIWDLYRFKPGTASNANFATATRALSVGADAGDRRVQFNGNTEVDLSTGKPDGTGGDGRQSSHWKDDAQGVPYIGIMDPTIPRGVHKQITANDTRALDFFGYSVGQVFTPPAPANDNFAAAQQLSGTSGRVTGTNVGATKEAGEPSHSPDGNPGGKSVWYTWQSPSSGTVTFITGAGALGGASDFDTLIGAYTGSGVGGLVSLGKSDDISGSDHTSLVTFNAVAGTTYRIAVDGYDADEGNIALSWNLVVAPPPPPPLGTIVQFAAASGSANETSGSAPVTITRGGDLSSTSSVIVRTIDDTRAIRCDDTASAPGTAFARCDYATTVQTVTFAAGENSKTVSIPLVDDSFVEPVEVVVLTLGGVATGATVGPQNTMTLAIVSNEAPGQTGANPILDPTFFVRMQYLDFLSREPDAGGMAAWVGTLNACAPGDTRCDRASVSSGFFRSQEFELKGRFVFNFYKVSLGRLPRYSEIVADMSSVTGVSTAEVVARKAAFTDAWAQRLDFLSLYGGMSNTQLVNTLMDRYGIPSITTPNPATPDDASQKILLTRADLIGRLGAGTLTRAQLVRAVASSDEVGRAEFNSAFVAMQYFGYLRRDPDEGGYNDWLRTINLNPNDIHSMVNGFVSSDEYRLRFGSQ